MTNERSHVIASAMSISWPIGRDTRSPEQIEADNRRWDAERDEEKRRTTADMMVESEPLLRLVGERIVAVERERSTEKYEEDLLVRIKTESGLVLRLKGTSHDYDGEDASIEAVAE